MENLKIFKNTFYQTFSRIFTSLIGFVITILIARQFGVFGFGDFTKIISFVGLFYLITDFGLNAIFLQDEKNSFKNLFYLRLIFSLFLVILVNLISNFLPTSGAFGGFPQSVKIGINIYSLSLFAQSILFSSSALFQKNLKYDLLMRANIFGSILILTLIVVFNRFSLPINYVLTAFVLGNFLSAFLSLVWTREKIFPFSLNYQASKKILLESLPLSLMLIFNLVYFRIDIFILSILKPTIDVGVYGFSYKFFDFLIALPLFLSNSLYPFLIKREKDEKNFLNFSKSYFYIFLFSSIFLLIICWNFAPLIALVKKEFILSILPFRIMLLSLPFFFLTSFLQWILISKKKQKYLMTVYLFSAIVNIVLNILFIPMYSYVASAIITGVSEAIVFLFLFAKVLNLTKNTQNGRLI